jgi:hypothetical protein
MSPDQGRAGTCWITSFETYHSVSEDVQASMFFEFTAASVSSPFQSLTDKLNIERGAQGASLLSEP